MNLEMNQDEQQTENRIETVLAALREAKPAAGMEQRISAALLRQADAASEVTPRWIWLRMPQIAGVAVVVAAALAVSARFYWQAPVAPTTDRVAVRMPTENLATKAADGKPLYPNRAEKAAGLSPLNPATANEGLQPRPASSGAKAPLQRQRVSGLKAAAFSRNARPTLTGNAGPTIAGSAKSLPARRNDPRTRETAQVVQQEQGFPAPPLPLTEQERLLIRLVHRDDPVQLAQLVPAAREIQLQRDREQVREFFKPPPMPAANFKLEPYPVTGGSE